MKGAIEQLLKPLSEAVAALYNNYRMDNELTRKTIQTQLRSGTLAGFRRGEVGLGRGHG